MISITSWDELIEHGANQILGKAEADLLQIDKNLVFEIRICGKSWDGFIDYRGANFVIELQKAINRIYEASRATDIPGLKNLNKAITVKVRVKEGSSLIEINASEALNRMLNSMNGDQITLIVGLAIFCTAGYFTIKQVLDYKKKKAEAAANERINTATIDKLTSTIDKALDVIEKTDAMKPPRKLVKEMEEGDRIVFHDNQKLDYLEAKHRYPKKPRSSRRNEFIDDKYTIRAMEIDKYPPVLTLDKDGFSFKADAQLHNQDIEKLSKDFETAWKSGVDLEVSLQVHISFNNSGIKSASITGIGEKRANSFNIMDLTTTWS